MSYGNMKISRKHGMDREDEEMNIYANVDHINISDVRTETENSDTKRHQTPQHTGRDTVRNRSSRAAPVCLVLLCVLLLTAIIVLCVYVNTKRSNYTEETHQLLTKITNLTEERDELLSENADLTKDRDQQQIRNADLTKERDQQQIRNTDLTKERDQLQIKNTDLTKERDQQQIRNTDLTKERDQQQIRNTDLTKERDQQQIRNTDLTKERDQLLTKNMQLTKERDGLSSRNLDLIKHRDQLNKEKDELSKSLREKDQWICFKSSLYFFSSEKKSWFESRRYCTERGADLTIINNREEQVFVKKISADVHVWIGLTDRDVEGRWTWVDGSTATSEFWASGEPNSNHEISEDCALNYRPGWADYPCNTAFQWICEKVILK